MKELRLKNFNITPGLMGENITTDNIDLLALPKGTILQIGATAHIEITGLRNPCYQLEGIQKGLMQTVLNRDEEGNLIRKTGVMAVVLESGELKVGNEISVQFPEPPFEPLDRV